MQVRRLFGLALLAATRQIKRAPSSVTSSEPSPRIEAMRLADAFRARVIDASTESLVFEITGNSAAWHAWAQALICSNCALRSGCEPPSLVLRLLCKLYPAALNRVPTVHGLMGCPCRTNSSARWAVLLQVQRNGDIGSPRLTGSTSCSSAGDNPGSESVRRLRPPPFLRKRESTLALGFFLRTANSANPLRIVLHRLLVVFVF